MPRDRAGPAAPDDVNDRPPLDSSDTAPAIPVAGAAPVPRASPTPLEAALGGLWANMLRLKRVDRDADFFLLGGDSLRGSALLDEVRALFGVDLPVAWLFEEAGTVAGMARCIERARANASAARPVSIPKRDRAAPVPLTHQQSRVWFLHRLDPTSHAYHEMRCWRVDGPLDVDALRRALALVAERQAVLRTRYVAVDGVPWQVIDEAPRWSLEEVDLSAAADPARAADALVVERKERPFDLAAAAPFRIVLIRLAPERHRLLRIWHHVVSDGLANPEFQSDLGVAYAAARAGRAPNWRPLKIDYADYAAWQAREIASPAVQASLEVLRARLDGVPTLALATDHARPPVQRHDGDVVTVHVAPASLAALRELGRAQGATAAITYFAVFQVLLHRLTGDEDFAVGTPVSGRTRPELRPLVGFFANTLAVRADLSGSPSFAEVLRRVRARLAEALERQEVPFDRLVDALGIVRDPSRNPLFQVAFGLREDASRELELDGLVLGRELGRSRHAKFDLIFLMLERAGQVDIHIEYATGLFSPPTIQRMARQFAALVDAIVAAPDVPVGSLPLMDDEAARLVVDASLGAPSAYPSTSTVDRCFAEAVAASPDAIAVAAPGRGGLDYRALEARANRLARALVAAGVTRGMRVGVSLGGAEDIATAWLAVLKAGAAYVPIDADLPADRIAFLFDDARIAHLVTEETLVARLQRPRMHVVALDRDAARLAREDPAPLPAATGPDDAAYVIYTSGSTGEPKGVVVPHRAILRLVRGADYLQLAPGDRVAQLARPAFDASTFEFWGTLLNGATIVPVAKATALAPRAFADMLVRERVSVLFLTTALFNTVARECPEAFAGCRAVLFGGEAVEVAPVRAVLAAKRPARLVHVYGPTEATTFATWHEVREVPANAATIPIGRPIANTDAFVLRADGGLAAEGEPGELVLGGPGLALGYLGREALSAERFVELDLGPAGRRRVYRTGDRVRRGHDGALEFLGRRDRQVKLRGFRIELDEVEAQLAKLPQVREAAVMLLGESSDTRKLVAWLVPADPDGPPPANLWRDMKRRMPEWMLPGAIVWVPALPLNANGKVDRRALPAPADDAGGGVGGGLAVPPRDMLEATVARVWSELLGTQSIGVHDHFFEIGGHSLLAARLVDAVERRTGVAIPLTALFADDTIAGMAAMLRDGARFADESITALHDDPARTPFVYLHGDFESGGFYSRALAHALGAGQPMLVVHPLGLRPGEDVPDTIEAMASRHVAALRARRPRGPYVLGGHCNGALVAFEMARQLVAAGEAVPQLVLVESRAPASASAATGEGGRGSGYVRAGALGGFEPVKVDNRTHELNLRYLEAIDRYAGGPFDGDALVINAERSSRGGSDGGWPRLVPRTRLAVVPGDHTSLLTVHLDRVARLVGEAIAGVGAPVGANAPDAAAAAATR
jgi:amino acid adenylation domain-containing protein